MCNRVARSLFDIGDQAGICAQLFYVKERSYGFEQELDVAIKVVMVMKDMICKKEQYSYEEKAYTKHLQICLYPSTPYKKEQ